MKTIWLLLKDAGSEWLTDKAPRLGAALAYYTIFSLAPLLVIVTAIAGFVFGQEAVSGYLTREIQGLVGDEGAKAVQAMVASAREPKTGVIANLIGVALLLPLYRTILHAQPASGWIAGENSLDAFPQKPEQKSGGPQ